MKPRFVKSFSMSCLAALAATLTLVSMSTPLYTVIAVSSLLAVAVGLFYYYDDSR
jgi:hypothetical protein